jgi:hypothetical protein
MAKALTSVHFHSRTVSVNHDFTCATGWLAEVVPCSFRCQPNCKLVLTVQCYHLNASLVGDMKHNACTQGAASSMRSSSSGS